MSATSSGLLILPLTAGIVAGSVGSGRLTAMTGRYKIYPIVGSACAVVGMALLSVMQAGTPRLALAVAMVLLRARHRDGHAGVAARRAERRRAPRPRGGHLVGAVLQIDGRRVRRRGLRRDHEPALALELPARLSPEALAEVSGEVTELLSSPASIQALPAATAAAVTSSLEVSIQAVFTAAAPVMVLGFVLAWYLDEIPLRETVESAPPVDGVEEAGV